MLKKILTKIFAMFAILAFASPVFAIVYYSPSAGLGIGSVRSTHLLDGTIVNADHSTSDVWQFSGVKIATTSSDSKLEIYSTTTSGNKLIEATASSSGAVFTALDNNVVIIGNASASSSLYVYGTTTTTGLRTPSGVNLALPTTAGTSGQVLTYGSSGVTSWASGSDWQQVGQTILSSANSNLNVSSLPARKHLKVEIFVPNSSNANNTEMTFNADSGANYSCRRSENNGADATALSATKIALDAANTPKAWSAEFTINASSTVAKQIFGTIISDGTAAAAPDRTEIAGTWNNTASSISSINILLGGANTFNAGSVMTVYASKD